MMQLTGARELARHGAQALVAGVPVVVTLARVACVRDGLFVHGVHAGVSQLGAAVLPVEQSLYRSAGIR
jgi:hypothetical protein